MRKLSLYADPAHLDRSETIESLIKHRRVRNQVIRQRVILERRLDVLCEHVLGYTIKPFHLAMIQFQEKNLQSLQLGFRGSGKSHILTKARIVMELLIDPNLRILIGSKTQKQAEGFLRGIKQTFMSPKFIAVFGNRVGDKWETSEINVRGRTSTEMESNVSTIGVEGAIVSRHFNQAYLDDIVSEENSKTPLQRDKVYTWYYKEFEPCLLPGEDTRLHLQGTNYHHKDFYEHLKKHEFSEFTQIVPALDKKGGTPWPERFPVEYFLRKKANTSTVIFNSQYQCDTRAMEAAIFQPDWFREWSSLPSNLRIFQAVDPAISLKTSANYFASSTIGIDHSVTPAEVYELRTYQKRMPFRQQVETIISDLIEWNPERLGIEANAYQAALYEELRADPRTGPYTIVPIYNTVDKKSRAFRLSGKYEQGRIYHRSGSSDLEDQLIDITGEKEEDDDMFDAVEMSIRLGLGKRGRAAREEEPGLI